MNGNSNGQTSAQKLASNPLVIGLVGLVLGSGGGYLGGTQYMEYRFNAADRALKEARTVCKENLNRVEQKYHRLETKIDRLTRQFHLHELKMAAKDTQLAECLRDLSQWPRQCREFTKRE